MSTIQMRLTRRVVASATAALLLGAAAGTPVGAGRAAPPAPKVATWLGLGTTVVEGERSLDVSKCGLDNGGDSDLPYLMFELRTTSRLQSPSIKFGSADSSRSMVRFTQGYRYLYLSDGSIDLDEVLALPVTASWVGVSGLKLRVARGCVGPQIRTGGLYGAGYNYEGQIGNGSNEGTVPTLSQAGTDTTWTQIALGIYQSAALKADGTLWGWGYGGATGDGTTANRNAPVQLGTATDWAKVFGGAGYATFAIKTDGTLWAWGYNGNGQLGTGTTLDDYVTAPVQIGTATDWSFVAPGWTHTLALKTDGTLWAWGYNSSGELGDSTSDEQLAPVQVGTATWQHVAAGWNYSLGVKADGTLWGWGYNDYGQVGTGTTDTQSTPVQIGTATNWIMVAANYQHSAGVRSDGTLWAWGANSSGQVGDGTTDDRYEPTRVGTGTAWASVSLGDAHTVALQSDGTAWAWGDGSYGQLCDGGDSSVSAPQQIGTSTGWVALAANTGRTSGLLA